MTQEHADIMLALAQDDPKALDLILDRFHPLILAQVLAVVGNSGVADDVAQDVYVTIARNRHLIARADNLGAYVRVLARHEAIQYLRKRPLGQPLPSLDLLEVREDASSGEDESQLIEQALMRLPMEQREVVVLHLWQAMTFSEIASQLGISANTAASRYRYACDKLRFLLDSRS